MRRLSFIFLSLVLFCSFSMVQAQNAVTLPRMGFCGLIGEPSSPDELDSQLPSHNAASVLHPPCKMDISVQEFTRYYREFGYAIKRQSIQNYQGLIIDTQPSPEDANIPADWSFNAELRAIYLYDKKQLIGYHLMPNTSIGYDFEDEPLLMQIKALPKQVLTEAPGGIPVPPGLIVEEYDASTATHIEKFLFVRSSEIQQILTHSFYPRPLQAQMDEMMADYIFQNLREIHKRWAD